MATKAIPQAAADRIAHFRLLREIGRGAQAVVWLAHDPRLDREVAIKRLKPRADSEALASCLDEGRAVSRLSHPNIVPVFEAGEHEGEPYLVFEYVAGPTLSQVLRQGGVGGYREAVTLMQGVLQALQAAHEKGLVHRDLKPSNVLLSGEGAARRARVMDFGIAAPIATADGPASGRIVGTPGYVSPEAARGAAPLPAMDVFSAGMLLAEMLSGRPLLQEADPLRALHRVQHEDMQLPHASDIDSTLRGIVQRAIARDPALRYESAADMAAALGAWLNGEPEMPTANAGTHATLDFLLRRMRHRSDFPALSTAVVRIQRIAASETESIHRLTDEIMKDVALTHKLLRLVNTAHYSGVASGGVDTVTRAVALVGFAGIRNMALSLVLLEHMPDKRQAAMLKSEYLRSLMAGMLAAEIAPHGPAGEDAFLGALFQNLGRLLTEYYFPEEAQQIRQELGNEITSAAAREAVSQRVMGISYDDLGAGVAHAWGLPDSLQRVLRTPRGDWPARVQDRPLHGSERLRWMARSANALVEVMMNGAHDPHALQNMAEQHGPVLGVKPALLLEACKEARLRLRETVQALGLSLPPGAPARLLLDVPMAAEKAKAAAEGQADAATASATAGTATPLTQTLLEEALASATEAKALKTMDVSEMLRLVLSGLLRALDLRNVVLCLRDPASGRLVGRLGLGPGGAAISAAFRIAPDAAAANDLFAIISARGADLLVADTAAVANRLPAWYRRSVDAPTFLLLPLTVKGVTIGLIYADKARSGSLALGESELSLVRSLRDHVTQAFSKTG